MTRYSSLFSFLILSALVAFILPAKRISAEPQYTLITLLHTNDMHSNVSPSDGQGGVSRVSTLVKQIRAEMPNVVLLDAGDIIHGEPEEYYSGGQAIIGAMNVAGYDIAATGNHEYDFSLPVLQAVMRSAHFPFVSANVHAAGDGQWDQLKPYVFMDVGGVRLGILGLTTLDTITLHWPPNIKDIVIEDPIETAKKYVPELRKQADVVIVLSHIGAVVDKKLAAEVPGIDFIVGGHSHTTLSEWTWVGNTLIGQTGWHARNLGRMDFIVRKDESGATIVSVNGKDGQSWNRLPRTALGKKYPDGPLIALTSDVAEDPAVLREYQPYKDRVQRIFSEALGTATAPVAGGNGETPASDLVADAVRWFAKSDVSVIDAASVPPDGLKGGEILAGEAYYLIGGYTRQQIIVGRMSGRDLQTALNGEFAKKNRVTLVISGGRIGYELKDKAPTISSFLVGDQPINPEKQYTVAAQSYIMMEMMELAPSIEIVSELKATTREAIKAYIKAKKTINPPAPDRIRPEKS